MAESTQPEEQPPFSSNRQSAAEDERRYALIRSIREEGGAEHFVQSISQHLLLQHDANWGDLLGAAPQALCFLGQCFVATTSSAAISSLELPSESMLKEKTLRANLVHCSDLGRRAFSDAESKMSKVQLITTHICEPRGPIDKVLKLLDDEELAQVDLQRQLDRLKKYSQECVKDAAQVKGKFALWQDYAMQIRLACTAAGDRTENEKVKVQDNIFIAESRSAHQEEEVKRTEQETASFRSHVDVHKEVFKKATNDVPTGWNAVAQEAAGRLVNFFPDLISMARVAQPWALLSATIHRDEGDQEPSQGISKNETANPHEDYGFRISKQISGQLQSLRGQLYRGEFLPPDYGVHWNSLYGFSSSIRLGDSSDLSIDVALGLFRQARSQAPAPLGQPESASSREAIEILDMVIGVSEEIFDNKEAQKSFSNTPTPRDKGMIRRWRETINSACDRNSILEEQLKTAQMEHIEYIQNLKDSGSKRKKAKKGVSGILNKNNVQIARENYQAAQKALLESENLLAERTKREADSKIKFNEIQLELAKLNNKNVNMQEIITILKKCIDNLTEFQVHLGKLVSFFSSLNHSINIIHEGHAQEFLAQVKNMVQIDRSSAFGDQERRRARKKDLKDSLLLDALNLRGNYLVAGELASVYVDISRKHIMRGINAIERLGLKSGEDACETTSAEKAQQILKYARKAQSEISAMAEKRRNKLREELYIQDREITELGRMVERAGLEDGNDSDYENHEWDEA